MSILGDFVEDLACPLCHDPLVLYTRSLRCRSNHTFDLARQGYASLVVGGRPPHHGDTAAMVAARSAFLGAGHYRPIADAVSSTLPIDASGLCVDLAGGTGYYLARVLEERPALRGLSLDISRSAAIAAARLHPRLASVTADAWQRLPVRSGAADHVLNVFGPRNGPELSRITARGGTVTVVTPQRQHLQELRETFHLIGIDERKEERLDNQLSGLGRVDRFGLTYPVTLDRSDVENEVLMGPSAHHTSVREVAERVAALGELTTVTVAVTISRYIAP